MGTTGGLNSFESTSSNQNPIFNSKLALQVKLSTDSQGDEDEDEEDFERELGATKMVGTVLQPMCENPTILPSSMINHPDQAVNEMISDSLNSYPSSRKLDTDDIKEESTGVVEDMDDDEEMPCEEDMREEEPYNCQLSSNTKFRVLPERQA
jgi:hypothetical protein